MSLADNDDDDNWFYCDDDVDDDDDEDDDWFYCNDDDDDDDYDDNWLYCGNCGLSGRLIPSSNYGTLCHKMAETLERSLHSIIILYSLINHKYFISWIIKCCHKLARRRHFNALFIP